VPPPSGSGCAVAEHQKETVTAANGRGAQQRMEGLQDHRPPPPHLLRRPPGLPVTSPRHDLRKLGLCPCFSRPDTVWPSPAIAVRAPAPPSVR
jgi:hypothetical protein